MRTNKYYKMWRVALTMMLGILMVTCSEDEIQDTKMSRKLHLVMGTQNFTDVTNLIEGTRGLPDLYQTYGEHYGATLLPTNAGILGFLTIPGSEPIQSTFFYTDNTSNTPVRSWSSRNIKIDDPTQQQTYYFYGFMPSEAASSVSIAPYDNGTSSSYENGAVLTLEGINAVTSNDVCVIVGVKGYNQTPLPSITDDVLAMNTRLGQFDITLPGEENYAYLLVDHIFRSLKFSLKIDNQYSQLRTVKVRKMELTASTDGIQLVKTVNATITLQAKDDSTSPLSTSSIVVSSASSGTDPAPAVLYDEEDHKDAAQNNVPLTLETTAKNLRAYLAPIAITSAGTHKFVLETTYDVYDRKGNLIREREKAKNTFSISSETLQTLTVGKEYTFIITVNPTYLYVLSDPDLDSPTFTIN